jgi:3alpha(or 20beta)-hydroxysteroid dehydrogenase
VDPALNRTERSEGMSRWNDRVVVVTGGAQGIGEAIVRRFAAEGARVAILDIQQETGRQLAKELGDQTLFARCDVTEASDWQDAVSAVRGAFGRIDVLVNNAGILQMETIERTTAEDYLRIVRVNELGTFLGIQAVVAPMRELGGGAIVNMSTIHALKGCAGAFMLSYGATKAAVISLTESAALELARFRIRVCCVTPGWVAAPMALEAKPPPEMIESMKNRGAIGGANPWGAQIQPEEVADTVVFLASDEAAAYNGSNLVLDRGSLIGSYPDLPADR